MEEVGLAVLTFGHPSGNGTHGSGLGLRGLKLGVGDGESLPLSCWLRP